MKKSQIISFDLTVSFFTIILFVSLVLGVVFIYQKNNMGKEKDFEMEFILQNFETNLKANQDADSEDIDFLNGYRVNRTKLDNFYSNVDDDILDLYIVSSINNSHGIGLSEYSYDTCLYFNDIDGTVMEIAGKKFVGKLKLGTCEENIVGGLNPCDDYNQAISFFWPILMDDESHNAKIVKMNILLCKAI